MYNLKSKTDIEKLFFEDINAMVEFFVEPSIEGAYDSRSPYGFRVMRDSLNAGYIIENKRMSNSGAVETVFYPVEDDFAEKLHNTIQSAIKHFVMKGEPAEILDGSTVTFRCVVGDEIWTLTIYEPDNKLLQLTDVCKQLIVDGQSKNVDKSKYITLFENVTDCSGDKEDDIQIHLYESLLIEQGGSLFGIAMSKEQKQKYKKLAEVVAANLKLQNDKIVFMDKSEFLSKGFPDALYSQFIQDIELINVFIANDSLMLDAVKKKLPIQMAKLREKIAK
ncbi:MAG: hypothetical protein LBE13_01650 [Bacteroidales bacterium]|jgi:hypothetical protein|nr:hypothetical protein [Bacteroidales bacterium]